MRKISIEGMKVHAYHGCLEEEAKIGGQFVVDVHIEADFSEAAKTDDLTKTVDYVKVYEIVKEQMAVRSNLIEHVARRIGEELEKTFSQMQHYEVKVTKLNPPVNGYVEKTSVTWEGASV